MKTQGNVVPFSVVSSNPFVVDTDHDMDLLAEAFAWADSRRRRAELSTPLKIDFDSDYIDFDSGCNISIFVNGDRAIMRREWTEDHSVLYNSVMNYPDIKKVAPKSVARMIQNGLSVYKEKGSGYRAIYLMEKRQQNR